MMDILIYSELICIIALSLFSLLIVAGIIIIYYKKLRNKAQTDFEDIKYKEIQARTALEELRELQSETARLNYELVQKNEEQKKLLRAVEQVSSVVVMTDREGNIEYVNPQFYLTTGYSSEEVIGANPRILKSGRQDNKVYKELWDTIKAGGVWKGEVLNKKKNGTFYWALISISPIRNSKGDVINFIAVQEDITNYKRLQEQLSASNEELKNTIEKFKLTQAHLVHQEKLAGIGQLAAGVAHEINNPLGYISSNLDTLKKYLDKLMHVNNAYNQLKLRIKNCEKRNEICVPDTVEELERSNKIEYIKADIVDLLKDMDNGLERISTIVNGLKAFSRVDLQNEFTEYNLNEGVKNTVTVAQNQIKYYAEIEMELQDIPNIEADGSQINQVLLNLIINAVHAIKEKHIEGIGHIGIKTYSEDEYVFCQISDDGKGMSQDVVTRIFEPFYTTKPVGQGTGLGLSIAYDLVVNKHKGEIQVESAEGKGSVFRIKLPIK